MVNDICVVKFMSCISEVLEGGGVDFYCELL